MECQSLKTRIEILDKILYNTIYEKYPQDPYYYFLHKMAIRNTLRKLDKLENRYYSLCTTKEFFEK
jgi:hypothetical protein